MPVCLKPLSKSDGAVSAADAASVDKNNVALRRILPKHEAVSDSWTFAEAQLKMWDMLWLAAKPLIDFN